MCLEISVSAVVYGVIFFPTSLEFRVMWHNGAPANVCFYCFLPPGVHLVFLSLSSGVAGASPAVVVGEWQILGPSPWGSVNSGWPLMSSLPPPGLVVV